MFLIVSLSAPLACARSEPATSTTTAATRPCAPRQGARTPAAAAAPATDAIALLTPTSGQPVQGTVRFRQLGDGRVEVTADFQNLPSGSNRYLVHRYGDCSDPLAESAGPTFELTASSSDAHDGTLGEIVARPATIFTTDTTTVNASLDGPSSIVGRAVVVHAHAPDGGAGARLACGVIGLAKPRPQQDESTPTAAITPGDQP